MPRSVVDAIRRWSQRGMYWPFVHDPQRREPSVTLMFFYITFVLAITTVAGTSILMCLKGDYLTATIMPTMLLGLGFVFYRLRNLDQVKIDFDDREIELSDHSNSDEPTKDKSDVPET